MNWKNVRLIFEREVRDQLRDRRTLFMIFVLPILLYPLLGLSFFQIAQFVHEHPTEVLLIGQQNLPASPPLIEGNRFAAQLFAKPAGNRLLEVHAYSGDQARPNPKSDKTDPLADYAAAQVRDGKFPLVVYFPDDFAAQLAQRREQTSARHPDDARRLPEPRLFYNSAVEKSQLAYLRVTDVLDRWRKRIATEELAAAGISPEVIKPFELKPDDVASTERREAAPWAKIFPFLLLIWALTGGFYPAIDLCAGEKERGTLETLLSSPAARGEIVWGKLFTVMAFSIATVVLNVLSMGISGTLILSKLPHFGPPPLSAFVWLLVAVVPISAMFSALCLALAAFARSTKEGQYYLMPLLLVTMPLVVFPMAPGVELNLGNSLIPITGIVLLLRYMVEGNYAHALPYVAPVVIVTGACCLLSIRWAIDQFNSEGVLFRESERLDLNLWLTHLVRDREETPGVAQAALCGVLILVIRFFLSFTLHGPTSFLEFAQLALITQLVVVLTPALLMTIMFTRSPRKTLLLSLPPWWGVPVAVVLAALLHPVATAIQDLVMRLYPLQSEIAEELSRLVVGEGNVLALLLVLALAPAICEELAFRGFVLSGFRHLGHKWQAIVLSSVFFGLSHAIFQQSLIASLLGLVLGYVAVQTGSILPGIVFHALHNSFALLMGRLERATYERYDLSWLGEFEPGRGIVFDWSIVTIAGCLAIGAFYWIHRQPYRRTAEEALQEAIEHQAAQGFAS